VKSSLPGAGTQGVFHFYEWYNPVCLKKGSMSILLTILGSGLA
jgi:hypothetical protein